MKQAYSIYNDFSKGLITDSNEINQDPNTATEIDNFIINNNGTISKRKGLEVEGILDTGIVLPDVLKNKNINSHIWKNVNKEEGGIFVLQNGEMLYFYIYSEEISKHKIVTEINLIDFLTSERLLLEDLKIKFTEIKGRLLCTHTQLTPFYLEYNNGEVKAKSVGDLAVRDYYGIEDNLGLFERPKTLTKEHLYNLYNQGWDTWMVYSVGAALNEFPANSDIVNRFYKNTLEGRYSLLRFYAPEVIAGTIPRYTLDDDVFNIYQEIYKNSSFFVPTPGHILNSKPFNDVGDYYTKLRKGYGANLIDFYELGNKTNDYEAPKGRVIKSLFDPEDVSNIVSRPILKKPDEGIDRTKWNDFHVVENVLDVFFDDVKQEVKLVLELDKEHDMYGGFNETTNCVVNAKLGHYDELNQKKIGDTSDYRIFSYEYPDVIKYLTKKNNFKHYKIDEGIWYSDGTSSTDNLTKFKKQFRDSDEFQKIFSYMEHKATSFYISNLTNDPHEYKALYYENNWFSDWGLVQTRRSMNEEYLRTTNFTSKFVNSASATPAPMFKVSAELTTHTYYSLINYGNVIDSSGTFNASGSAKVPSYTSHSRMTYNGTQFDFQKVKHKTVSAPKITDIELKDITCKLEALSTKKCILNIPLSVIENRPSDWNFNASEVGELLCYNDIYNSMKIKLSQSLYDKQKKVYENMKRDEYASKKLDEEYKDNADYFSVKRINTVITCEPRNDGNDSLIERYPFRQKQRFAIVVELDKPFTNRNVAANRTQDNTKKPYVDKVNLIQGDYTKYLSNDLYNNKRVLMPLKYRMHRQYSIDTTTPEWGDYYSDYMRHLSAQTIVTTKPKEEWPAFLQSYNVTSVINQDQSGRIPNYTSSNANAKNYWAENKITAFELGTTYIAHRGEDSKLGVYSDIGARTSSGTALVIYVREDSVLEAELIKHGWAAGRGNSIGNTAPENFATTGQPENVKAYYLSPYTRNSDNKISAYYSTETSQAGLTPSPYDFIEAYIAPMNLNMDKAYRKCLKEQIDVQFAGDRYLIFSIGADESLKYTDIDELVTAEDDLKEMALIAERNGMVINLHEILNMKFSLDNSIPRSEITPKQRAYRKEWTWDMDGDNTTPAEPDVDPDNLIFEDVREEFRPNCSEAFCGRIFYGGINCNKYTNTIFYSKIITENIADEIGRCYSDNDPTSMHLNKPLATDGGYISIDGAGEILGMGVVGSVLCVVCSNGVWGITGGDGYFTATNQVVKKLSNVGCIAPESIKVVEDMLIYLSEYSINVLQLNSLNADLTPNDITKNRINNLYNDIPLSSKKYIKTIYDKVKGIIYFLYNDKETDDKDPSYTNVLIFNLVKQSFFTFSFDEKGYKIKDGFINEFNYKDDMRLKLICKSETDIKFYEFKDENFVDFTTFNYEAKLTTSSQIVESPTNKLVGGNIITHLLNKDNGSCLFNVEYDFENPNKVTKPIEVYKIKPNNLITYNRVMLRGEGHNMKLKYVSPHGKDCEILGFEINYNVIVK